MEPVPSLSLGYDDFLEATLYTHTLLYTFTRGRNGRVVQP